VKNILITCPSCRETLEIDPSRGVVVAHHPELKPKPGTDFLKQRIKSIEEEKAKRAALVESGKENEKNRSERHQDLFRKVKEQAKEGPGEDRPLREVDLD
jgi:hypothetical protein